MKPINLIKDFGFEKSYLMHAKIQSTFITKEKM